VSAWGLPYELALPPKGTGKSHTGLEYKSACLLWLKAERDSIRDEPRARLDRVLERDRVPSQTMA